MLSSLKPRRRWLTLLPLLLALLAGGTFVFSGGALADHKPKHDPGGGGGGDDDGGGGSATYTLVNIGTIDAPDGQASRPKGINGYGDLAGSADVLVGNSFIPRAFVLVPEDSDGDGQADTWFREDGNGGNALMSELGTLGGESSGAGAINDSTVVVGAADTGDFVDGHAVHHAFAWISGSMIDLGTLGGPNSRAHDINECDEVAGFSDTDELFTPHAVYWRLDHEAGTVQGPIDLGTLGGPMSSARGINNFGEIVGVSDTGGGESHAAYWQVDADGTVQKMTDLGTLGGTNSEAFRINDMGEAVGASETSDGELHAVLWTLNDAGDVASILDLGKLEDSDDGSQAFNINNFAETVGTSWNTKTKGGSTVTVHRAVLWDLATSSVVDIFKASDREDFKELWFGNGINDDGLIVGEGLEGGRQGGVRGFVALPPQ